MTNFDQINIFTQADLDCITTNGIINNDLHIAGINEISLEGINEINGSASIRNSTIRNLGNIRKVTGDLFIGSTAIHITSLFPLEKVNKMLYLRYTNIIDLGILKSVGDKLNLRDTPIVDFGKLDYVGGDLFLPKRLQNNINLNSVIVNGNIRYWNDIKESNNESSNKIEYDNFTENIIYWEKRYMYSFEDIRYASQEQQAFYQSFKKLFFENKMIDLKGNDNYAFLLLFDLVNNYKSDNKFDELLNHLEKLGYYYSPTYPYIKYYLIEQYENSTEYEKAWNLISEDNSASIKTLIKYQKLLKRSLITSDLIIRHCGISHLSDWGIKNIELIKPNIMAQYNENESKRNKDFFDLFYINDRLFEIVSDQKTIIDYEHYKEFFGSESEYEFYKENDFSRLINSRFPEYFESLIAEKAIVSQLRVILKQAEDNTRESLGLPKVGEGWISETDLYYKIKSEFTNHTVIHGAKPEWLGRQHLDIYIKELNIGIEYQGLQHFEPVNFFGGEESFIKNMERDFRKKQLCEENNCLLIYVLENYEISEIFETIRIHELKNERPLGVGNKVNGSV